MFRRARERENVGRRFNPGIAQVIEVNTRPPKVAINRHGPDRRLLDGQGRWLCRLGGFRLVCLGQLALDLVQLLLRLLHLLLCLGKLLV